MLVLFEEFLAYLKKIKKLNNQSLLRLIYGRLKKKFYLHFLSPILSQFSLFTFYDISDLVSLVLFIKSVFSFKLAFKLITCQYTYQACSI